MTNEELAVAIQGGRKDLLDELWEQTMNFFWMKAGHLYKFYRDWCLRAGVTKDDIFQCCYFALLDGVQAFKADSGYKLLTYTQYHLRNQVRALIGIKTSKRYALNGCKSLNESIDEDGNASRLELMIDSTSEQAYEAVIDNLFQKQLRPALETSISKLADKRATIMRKRWFEGKTLREVASESGLTYQRISQIECEAFQKLQRDKILREFRNEILTTSAYRATGLNAFKEHLASSPERAVVLAEEQTYKAQKELLSCY